MEARLQAILPRLDPGRHVLIAGPTASGKTLCYNLPVLDAILREPQARASGKPQDQPCGKHSCNQYPNLPVSQRQPNHVVPAWNTIYKLLTESQPQYVV